MQFRFLRFSFAQEEKHRHMPCRAIVGQRRACRALSGVSVGQPSGSVGHVGHCSGVSVGQSSGSVGRVGQYFDLLLALVHTFVCFLCPFVYLIRFDNISNTIPRFYVLFKLFVVISCCLHIFYYFFLCLVRKQYLIYMLFVFVFFYYVLYMLSI